MKDILLTYDGDLHLNEYGDIEITDSVRQAVRIRLLWFFSEWRFAPGFGVPYFEEILVKKPNLLRIKRIIRDEAMSVDEVRDVQNISIDLNKTKRAAIVSLDIVTAEETFREEVEIIVYLRGDAAGRSNQAAG